MMCRKCGVCADRDEFDGGLCAGCQGKVSIPQEEWEELGKAGRKAMRAQYGSRLTIIPIEFGPTMDAPSHPDSSNYN